MVSLCKLLDGKNFCNLPLIKTGTREEWGYIIEGRLRKQEQSVPYDLDEYPVDPLLEMVEKTPRVREYTPLARAAADVLAGLNPRDEDLGVIFGAVELVAFLHTRYASKKVVELLQDTTFLSQRSTPRIHNALLYALACMQRPGDYLRKDLLMNYLAPVLSGGDQTTEKDKTKMLGFSVPAFAGIAMGSKGLPGRKLVLFLRGVIQAEKRTQTQVCISPAILALYSGRKNRNKITREIKDRLKREGDSDALLSRLKKAIAHTEYLQYF